MSERYDLDRIFALIMKTMAETGQAPHYIDVARKLKISMEEGRKSVHALFKAGVPGWLYPGGDLIVSFAPFNNLPTQFRISVDGQQKWFGQ